MVLRLKLVPRLSAAILGGLRPGWGHDWLFLVLHHGSQGRSLHCAELIAHTDIRTSLSNYFFPTVAASVHANGATRQTSKSTSHSPGSDVLPCHACVIQGSSPDKKVARIDTNETSAHTLHHLAWAYREGIRRCCAAV
jgi:hypothetical protein